MSSRKPKAPRGPRRSGPQPGGEQDRQRIEQLVLTDPQAALEELSTLRFLHDGLPDWAPAVIEGLRGQIPDLLDALFLDGGDGEIIRDLALFGPVIEGPLLDRLAGADPRDLDLAASLAQLAGQAGLRAGPLRDHLRTATVDAEDGLRAEILSWTKDPALAPDLLELAQRAALGEDDGTLGPGLAREALLYLGHPVPAWLA
jgi:hypothetical protein